MSSKKSIVLSVIILLTLIVGGYFAFRVIFIYNKILNGEVDDVAFDFSDQMTIGNLVSTVEPDVDLAEVDSDSDPYLGSDNPILTIVEFADFQCSHCQAVSSSVRRLASIYGDYVRFVYRDFPVSDIHPDAQLAAEAAECAHDQDKFWAYHDKLYQNQDDLSLSALNYYAAQVGLDTTAFSECLEYSRYRTEVQDDYADGVLAGVTGTPTFFFNGSRVAGAIPSDIFEAIINGFLE